MARFYSLKKKDEDEAKTADPFGVLRPKVKNAEQQQVNIYDMAKAYVFLADGFEDIEALAPVDPAGCFFSVPGILMLRRIFGDPAGHAGSGENRRSRGSRTVLADRASSWQGRDLFGTDPWISGML